MVVPQTVYRGWLLNRETKGNREGRRSALLKDTLRLWDLPTAGVRTWVNSVFIRGEELGCKDKLIQASHLAAVGCEAQRGQVVTPRITELMSKQEQSPLGQ